MEPRGAAPRAPRDISSQKKSKTGIRRGQGPQLFFGGGGTGDAENCCEQLE